MGGSRNKMVKKPIILFFGASSGIVKEILKYFKNNYQIYAFYNKNNQWTVTRSSQQIGTRIHLEIKLNSRRTCKEVIKKIFDQDGKMVRIPVNLVRNKNEQVNSRIQAQSLLHNLKDLTEIEFDFQNIDFIGPAFADELVRKTKEKNQIADISWINSTKMVDVLMSRAMNRLT